MLKLFIALVFAGFSSAPLHDNHNLKDDSVMPQNIPDLDRISCNLNERYHQVNLDLEKVLDSLDYYQRHEMTLKGLGICIKLAELMRASGHYSSGVAYLNYVLAHKELHHHPQLSASAHNRLAAIYFELAYHNPENTVFFDSASYHCQAVAKYSNAGDDFALLANNLVIEAALLMLGEKYHEADSILLKASDIYTKNGLKPDLSFYSNLSKTWLELGKYDEALKLAFEYYHEMLAADNLVGKCMSTRIIGETYQAMGDTEKSKEYFAKSDEFGKQRNVMVEYLTVKELIARHEMEKADKNIAVLYRDRVLYLRLTRISIILFFALLIFSATMYYTFKQYKKAARLENELLETSAKADKLAIENATLQIEKQKAEANLLRTNLNDKDNLLTSKVLAISRINEMLIFILKRVQDINLKSSNPQVRKSISEISGLIRKHVKVNNWEEFDTFVASGNNDFIRKLCEAHPGLSSLERRLCLFLNMNMTTKEISDITMQNIRAIEMARHRLRSKFNLQREDSIQAYLQQFS